MDRNRVAGPPLYGDLSGAFPSGDGESGGDFEATFSVAALAAVQANIAKARDRTTRRVASGASR